MRGAQPDRQTANILRDFQQIKERVETLAGIRGVSGDTAVRRKDLNGLKDFGELVSRKVSASPTMDEFNALVTDVHAIRRQLDAISRLLER
jgi:hypothetical protein